MSIWSERARLASLSERERAVLDLLMQGLTPVEIAEREYVSITTVRSHVRSILVKLHVRSSLAAVAMGYRVIVLAA